MKIEKIPIDEVKPYKNNPIIIKPYDKFIKDKTL